MRIQLTLLSFAILVGNLCQSFAETEFKATEISSNSSFKCPEISSERQVFLDHALGCKVYHICENGHRQSFLCPLDTVFNLDISACDISGNTSCHAEIEQEGEDTNQIPSVRRKRSLRHVVSVPRPPLEKAFEELSKDLAPVVSKLMRTVLPAFSKLMQSSPELRTLWMQVGPRVFPWVGRGARSVGVIYSKIINEFPALKLASNGTHYEVRISEGLIDVYYFARNVMSVLYFGEEFNNVERSIDTVPFPQTVSSSKRSLNHVLTIPKEPLQKAFTDLSREFSPLASKLMRSSFPGLFNAILDSSPQLQSLWKQFGPSLLPWVGRRARNLQIVFQKILTDFPSLKIASNDVNYEIHISEGLVNIYRFARGLATTIFFGEESSRTKRSVNTNVTLDLAELVSATLSQFSQLFFKVLSSDLLSEIFWTETSVGNVQTAFWSGISAVGPVISEYFINHNRYFINSKLPESILVSIPKTTLRNAYVQFKQSAVPPIKTLTIKFLPRLLTNAAGKVPQLIGKIDRFMPFFWNNWSVVLDWFLTTAVKYDRVIKTSNSTHYNFVTLSEFKRDVAPGQFLVLRMITDFWGNEPNSIFPLIFGGNGVLSNIIDSLEREEYGLSAIAVPAHVASRITSAPTKAPTRVSTRAPSTMRITPEPCFTRSPLTASITGCILAQKSTPRSLNAT